MIFLEDQRLYSDTEYCLQFLRTLDDRSTGPLNPAARCHMFWYGAFSRKPALAVKSFLATQDLRHCELWLWLEAESAYVEHKSNPFLHPLLGHLRIKRFDPEAEALGTPLAGRHDLYYGGESNSRSNFARLVVLYHYGGVYVDADTLFLRDLSPLVHTPGYRDEFCYHWSSHMPYGNNAVLRLRRHGETAFALQTRGLARGRLKSKDILTFSSNEDLDLLILPSVFFDPLWPHADQQDRYRHAPFHRFADFFRPFSWRFRRRRDIRSYRDFFPGAFAYHWHNCWNAPEVTNSYFGVFEAEVDAQLDKQLRLSA